MECTEADSVRVFHRSPKKRRMYRPIPHWKKLELNQTWNSKRCKLMPSPHKVFYCGIFTQDCRNVFLKGEINHNPSLPIESQKSKYMPAYIDEARNSAPRVFRWPRHLSLSTSFKVILLGFHHLSSMINL